MGTKPTFFTLQKIGKIRALSPEFNVYVTGWTWSSDFPTVNPYQDSPGYYDAFVTKLSPSGDSLIYSTYLGGSYEDKSCGIAVDGQGSAYLTGWTYSPDFPLENPRHGGNAGGSDAFVAKLVAFNEIVTEGFLPLHMPKVFDLSQAFPNPFTRATTIRYRLPKETHVALKIYNSAGQLVKTLVDEPQKPGYYREEWDGKGQTGMKMAGGVYFYRIEVDKTTSTKKMILLR